MASETPPSEVARGRWSNRLGPLGISASIVAILALTGTPGAWAATSPSPPTPPSASSTPSGSLAEQAASLTQEIQAQGMATDRLSEQVDAAQIQVAQIAAELQGARKSLAVTAAQLHQASTTLANQAVAAYMQGGRAPLTYIANDVANNPALIDGYASVVDSMQQRDIVAYQALRRQQNDKKQALTVAESSATASVEQLQAARQEAEQAAAAEQATLTSISAQAPLSALVTQDETTQYQQTAVAVQARFNLPAAGRAATPSSPGVSTPAAGSPAVAAPVSDTAAAYTSAAPVVRSAPTTAPPAVVTAPPVVAAPSAPPSGASVAIAYAEAQLGKPYAWGGAGPSSFDCSGLVMEAWAAAGVYFPHLAQDQYDETARVAIGDLEPGDLVFFGTPNDVYHVGIYVGGGEMIDAPHTGADVRIEGIYWSDLLAGGRVT